MKITEQFKEITKFVCNKCLLPSNWPDWSPPPHPHPTPPTPSTADGPSYVRNAYTAVDSGLFLGHILVIIRAKMGRN